MADAVKRIVSEDPAVFILVSSQIFYFINFEQDGIITPQECARIRECAASAVLQRATVSNELGGMVSEGRTGKNVWLPIIGPYVDPTVKAVAQRISSFVEIPLTNSENLQVLWYGPGNEYKAHFDAYDYTSEKGHRCTRNGGQRLKTALIYLNEVEAGGETAFPELKAAIKPRVGRVVVFENCVRGTILKHPKSLHAARPVLRGEKWACNLWFRELPRAKSICGPVPDGISADTDADAVGTLQEET